MPISPPTPVTAVTPPVDYDAEIVPVGEKRKLSSDADYDSPRKRFKCDICRVAYAQGSTLDIHMRSVLHQTRACRQEQQKVGGTTPEQQNGQGLVSGANSQNSQMYKQLLENFGFDIVRQFNENGGAGLLTQATPSGGQAASEEIPADLLERFAAQFKHYLEKEGGEGGAGAMV